MTLRLFRLRFLWVLFVTLLAASIGVQPHFARAYTLDDSSTVYFPLLFKQESPTSAPRVNAPHFPNDSIVLVETAILWFGRVTPDENYADVRVGYNDEFLYIHVNVFDRRTWYDDSPPLADPEDLTTWDAVTILLDRDGNLGSSPDAHTYRIVGGLRWWESVENYQAAYQGNGSGWVSTPIPFTTQSTWVSSNTLPNDDGDDRGWWISYRIPFTSLGLSAPPVQGSLWGLGVVLHDRDSASGPPRADKTWPAGLNAAQPRTWGQLVFGLPGFSPPPGSPGGTVTIRHGLNGAVVPDAHVGGAFSCGQPFNPNFFNGWGDANYIGSASTGQINIQNQLSLGDWPCLSKYYVTIPLDLVPPAKVIHAATLTIYQFGGSDPSQANSSLVQVLTTQGVWNESTITWNNAPYAWENVSRAWVGVLPSYPGLPGVAREWDLSRAVSEAYQNGQPLRLVLYSSDAPAHSGKYFFSSDMDIYAQTSRPALTVTWGDP